MEMTSSESLAGKKNGRGGGGGWGEDSVGKGLALMEGAKFWENVVGRKMESLGGGSCRRAWMLVPESQDIVMRENMAMGEGTGP